MLRLSLPWPLRQPPGIAAQHPMPPHAMRAVRDALAAVDLDIELSGTVSAETVNKVRAARLELAYAEALRAACLLEDRHERRYACDAAHARYEDEREALGLEVAA